MSGTAPGGDHPTRSGRPPRAAGVPPVTGVPSAAGAAAGTGTGPARTSHRAASSGAHPALRLPPPAGELPSGPTSATTVLVIAKEPVPGRVKTRLTPLYRPEEAARLAEAALTDTLEAVARTPARRRVVHLDGRPGPWLPEGFDVVPQPGGGLDERIAAAFARSDGPALLIGMDTPQLTPRLLATATDAAAWDGCDAWFGPAADGGFWALGLADPRSELVRGVPMSRPDTGALQRQRLVDAGLSVRDLPVLRDVDTPADAAAVAALTAGHFAAVHADIARARAVAP